jgi:hypothetical protein
MKNQYFGDVNDYLKYGLLRCFSDAGLRIGVCWMLTPDDGRSDGRKITYISKIDRWRGYDPPLFDKLSETVRKKTRRVHHLEVSRLLPNTSFFSYLVPTDRCARKKWLERFIKNSTEADLLFFDPDNGIEVKSTPRGKRGASKFLFWDEIEIAWTRGSALLIFQHFCRENRDSFIARLRNRLEELLPDSCVVSIVTTYVVYFLVYRKKQEARINSALHTISERWRGAALVR